MGKKQNKLNNKQNKLNNKPVCNQNQNCNRKSQVAPYSQFLGNSVPLIMGNSLIYNNQNRYFFFLNTTQLHSNETKTTFNTNFQISFTNFLIGYSLDRIQKKIGQYDEKLEIHPDKNINKFIHNLLKLNFNIKLPFHICLNAVVSNGNAIQPLVNFSTKITPLNYIIVLFLHSIEKNPALFYGNNSYAENNLINFNLASQNITYPFNYSRL